MKPISCRKNSKVKLGLKNLAILQTKSTSQARITPVNFRPEPEKPGPTYNFAPNYINSYQQQNVAKTCAAGWEVNDFQIVLLLGSFIYGWQMKKQKWILTISIYWNVQYEIGRNTKTLTESKKRNFCRSRNIFIISIFKSPCFTNDSWSRCQFIVESRQTSTKL